MGCGSVTSEETNLIADKLKLSHLKIDNQGSFVYSAKSKNRVTVQVFDNFMTHHLENQISLSPFASANKVRARQIIEHYIFSDLFKTKIRKNTPPSKLTVFALKAWFQRTFQQIIDKVQKKYFSGQISQVQAKHQVCEEYVFQVYQMGQFINAGFNKFSSAAKNLQIPLSVILLSSDSALYPALAKIRDFFPLVAQNSNLIFPDVTEVKEQINLLDLFDSKCFSDPDFLNIQTLMDDVKFLLDQASANFQSFKKDMEDLLGLGTLVNCKVKTKQVSNHIQYDASSVRRVFIKWAQTIIQRIPQIYNSAQFLQFIRSKKKMANDFIFNGTVTPPTHQQVIEVLTGLLESVKYKFGSKIPREEFGLFIYDLLRCKTTRKTGQQVLALFQKLKNTTMTKSGKLFKFFRVKNRFSKNTRDLLINFRYGDHLIGEAQLCLDVSHEDPKLSKQNKFGHYIYELQRGLFGPTFEMIMKYEDSTRKELSVTLQAQGFIPARILSGNRADVKKAGRLCPQKHQMISITGNLFAEDSFLKSIQIQNKHQDSGFCDFCHQLFSYKSEFHYCYYCSIFYCLKCINLYKTVKLEKLQVTCLDRFCFKQLKSSKELREVCKQEAAAVCIFYSGQTTASILFLDQIAFYIASVNYKENPSYQICLVNVDTKQSVDLVEEFKIFRTPTTFIFDQKMVPQVTLVGCTFADIQSLLQIRTRIVNGLPKSLKIKCIKCNQEMLENADYKILENQTCQICMNTNKMDDLQDMIRLLSIKTKDFSCKNGHLKCCYCSYLCSNTPSYYRDFTGRTYLSTKLSNYFTFCSNYHFMQQKTISQRLEYQCYKCKKVVKGSIGTSAKFCSSCNYYICKDCSGTQNQNFIEKKQREHLKQVQIVSHFVENKLEEVYPCGCGKYFMKAYESHKLQKPRLQQFSIVEMLGIGSRGWKCWVCDKKETQLKLHLACFYCSYYQKLNGHKGHIQICIQCAINSGLASRVTHKKINLSKTNQKCSKNHNVIITSIRANKELKFECNSCRNWYCPSTERYQCQSCQIKICLDCGKKQLKDETLSVTLEKCDKSHSLQAKKIMPKLDFCVKCRQYIYGLHFQCKQKDCNYVLCHNCSKGQ